MEHGWIIMVTIIIIMIISYNLSYVQKLPSMKIITITKIIQQQINKQQKRNAFIVHEEK